MRNFKLLSVSIVLVAAGLCFAQGGADSDAAKAGRLAGIWKGTYHYPADGNQPSVNFQITIVHEGATVVGFIKEPNTFGERREPWLHATMKGRLEGNKLIFRKTYDGTAGPSHDVEYTGELSRDGTKVEGTWDITGLIGRFTLEKQRLDDRTLESITRGPD